MGKPTGFLEFTRELPEKQPVKERLQHFNEFVERYKDTKLNQQAARCMNCGIPFLSPWLSTGKYHSRVQRRYLSAAVERGV